MSYLQEAGSFAVVAALLTLTPGLDTTLVLGSAIIQGTRHAYATVAGICTGVLIWGMVTALGASALLAASSIAYTVLKVLGAAYMVWLGLNLYRRVVTKRKTSQPTGIRARTVSALAPSDTATVSWSRGLTANLLNPRFGLYFIATIPQFIPQGAPHLAGGFLLSGIQICEDLFWFSVLIFGVSVFREFLSRPGVQRCMDAVAGTALIGFGIRLLFFS